MASPTGLQLVLDPSSSLPPTRKHPSHHSSLPAPTTLKHNPNDPSPSGSAQESARLHFIGTATTILEWGGIRLMTDPNFLHAGDHVHLGPGVTSTRRTNPAIDLHELPRIDVVLLSHYHADHFDQEVEASLRRDLPIITTPHAKAHLGSKAGDNEAFTNLYQLDTLQSMMVDIKQPSGASDHKREPAMRVTAMPGKHVPPGILGTLNDIAQAVPPTNGWILELGYYSSERTFQSGYRIYISGDTLFIGELKTIPSLYPPSSSCPHPIDLMLVHLGGTTIPSPSLPLLMVTMDAEQGIKLLRLVNPEITIPIHYDDYDVMVCPLEDFKSKVEEHGLSNRVVYLDRGDGFEFTVKGP